MSQATPLINKRSSSAYIKTGLGGAGNFHPISGLPSAPVSAPTSIPSTLNSQNGFFSVGIGGAGNSRSWKDRAVLTPEQELSFKIARQENPPTVWYSGIGGAGNRTMSPSSASSASSFSWSMGAADVLKDKILNRFHRRGSTDSFYG